MINRQDAYETVFFFLSMLYLGNRARFNVDFPLLLGRMQILPDGHPVDTQLAALWNQLVIEDVLDDAMVMQAMERFLDLCRAQGETSARELSLVLRLIRSDHARAWRGWFANAVQRLAA